MTVWQIPDRIPVDALRPFDLAARKRSHRARRVDTIPDTRRLPPATGTALDGSALRRLERRARWAAVLRALTLGMA